MMVNGLAATLWQNIQYHQAEQACVSRTNDPKKFDETT